MRTLLALVLALYLPATALADTGYGDVYVDRFSPTDTGINGALLSSSPSFTLRSVGLTTWTIYANLTRVAATDIRLMCWGGPRVTTMRAIPVATPTADGNITEKTAQFGWYNIMSSGTYGFVVSQVLDDQFKCQFFGTSASSDTISVEARGQMP